MTTLDAKGLDAAHKAIWGLESLEGRVTTLGYSTAKAATRQTEQSKSSNAAHQGTEYERAGPRVTRMAELSELLARVEAATGPDRELDGTIWWLLYITDEQRAYHDKFGGVSNAVKQYGSYGRALEQFYDSANPGCLARIAFQVPFTSSIDAAFALVERKLPGHSLFLAITADKDELPCACDIANGTRDPWTASARTPPLAILAALLRALIVPQEAVKE